MSTFSGRIDEIPGISVDQFQKDNLNSKLFFLSHAHSDHMVGLTDSQLHKLIINENVGFYASEVTTKIVQLLCPSIAQHIHSLPLNFPHEFQVPTDGTEFSVTLIPAGHCPGSVMFLFETANSTVLYTGDFRVNANDLTRFKGFYSNKREFKKRIDKVYLDTTFMLRRYAQFPKRADSLKALYETIAAWISRSPNHFINLQTGAYYGGEVIYDEIYQRFKEPVHVNEWKQDAYMYFPNMDQCVTTDNSTVRIHSHCGSYKRICQPTSGEFYTRVINISAYSWSHWTKGSSVAQEVTDDYYRICYSSHSSYEELIQFLSFVKPKQIAANVIPSNEADRKEMYDLISDFLGSMDDDESGKPDFTDNSN